MYSVSIIRLDRRWTFCQDKSSPSCFISAKSSNQKTEKLLFSESFNEKKKTFIPNMFLNVVQLSMVIYVALNGYAV